MWNSERIMEPAAFNDSTTGSAEKEPSDAVPDRLSPIHHTTAGIGLIVTNPNLSQKPRLNVPTLPEGNA